MGVWPVAWGPSQWRILHLMAYTFPDKPTAERQKAMIKYIEGMCGNLPCEGCSHHATKYITENKPAVESKDALTKYFIDFHNFVNRKTGKRELTYEEARDDLHKNILNQKEWSTLYRADQQRKEDAEKINNIKKKLSQDFIWIIGLILIIISLVVALVLKCCF
jgi:hypothetical protein